MRGLGITNTPVADAVVESLLGWWALAGVDDAISETPVNWLKPPARPMAKGISAATAAPQTVVDAPLPDSLARFHDWLRDDAGLHEAAWSGPRILPTGNAGPALMVICDMPDADDLSEGALLSGEAGRLFDAMMAAIGWSRADIYLVSLAIARPIGGMLNAADGAALAQRMRHHVGLVAPRHILLLGEKTNRALMTANSGQTEKGLCGFNHPGGTISAVATFHPRLLLRQPAAKAEAWRALQLLIEVSRP